MILQQYSANFGNMDRKQRIHSAELRRLDHIARSLDRIGDAMERLHEVVVSGDNNSIFEAGGDVMVQNGGKQNMQNRAGHDSTNYSAFADNNAAAAASGPATVNSSGLTQNFNDEVSGGNIPMGDIKHLPNKPDTG